MSFSVSPISYGYSSDGFQSNIKQKPKISREELREYVKAGKVYSEIAENHPGVSKGIYDRLLDKFGFERDTARLQRRRYKTMEEMYKAGATVEDIAKAIGVSASTCKSYLIDAGMPCNKTALIARQSEKVAEVAEKSANKKEFAKAMGIGMTSANKVLEQSGAMTQKQKTLEFIQGLKRSTVQGWLDTYKTVSNISRHVQLSPSTVRKYIKFFGLNLK